MLLNAVRQSRVLNLSAEETEEMYCFGLSGRDAMFEAVRYVV